MSNRKKVGIVVGEDSDLPTEFIQQNDLIVYPFKLDWENNLKDRTKIYDVMLKQKTNKNKSFPKTSQPSVGQLTTIFRNALEKYEYIFVVCISSKLSGCYNSAIQAREQLGSMKNKVELIQSFSSSAGSAFVILEILRLLRKKTAIETIKDTLVKFQPKIVVFGMIEDAYWLQAGGRISPAIGILINQMKKIGIRPIFGMNDGKIALLKVRTHAKNKVHALLSYIDKNFTNQNTEVIINYTASKQEAHELISLIEKTRPSMKVIFSSQISPVLGAHLGPGAVLVGINTN